MEIARTVQDPYVRMAALEKILSGLSEVDAGNGVSLSEAVQFLSASR